MPAPRFNASVMQLMAGTSSSLWSYRDARVCLVRSTSLGINSFKSGDGTSISVANREDGTSDGIATWSPDTWRLTNWGREGLYGGLNDAGAAAPTGSASRLCHNAGAGPVANSATTGSLSVTTDKTDYAPGSTATFTVTGVARKLGRIPARRPVERPRR